MTGLRLAFPWESVGMLFGAEAAEAGTSAELHPLGMETSFEMAQSSTKERCGQQGACHCFYSLKRKIQCRYFRMRINF